MRDNNLFSLLANHYPDGVLKYPVYYLNKKKDGYIHLFDNPIIEVKLSSDKLQKEIIKLIGDYVDEKGLGIIIALNTNKDVSYVATNDTMKQVLMNLQSIENLSPTFEFINRIFYKCKLTFDVTGNLSATVDGKVHSLNSPIEIKTFNELQRSTSTIIQNIHTVILSVLQKEQLFAEYIKTNHLLSINDINYVCKVQFDGEEWHGYFFRKWSSNHIIQDKSNKKVYEFMIDIARKYISIEAEKEINQESTVQE